MPFSQRTESEARLHLALNFICQNPKPVPSCGQFFDNGNEEQETRACVRRRAPNSI